jgi:hypothetical protein
MRRKSAMKGTVDYPAKVKSTGVLALSVNTLAMFGILLFDYQSGGHGEMGSFYHGIMPWVLLFGVWGAATGIGLLRAWRWARISTLVFFALLAASGVLAVVLLLRAPGAGTSDWTAMMARVAFSLLILIPIIAGAIWWLILFSRTEVKAYFRARP